MTHLWVSDASNNSFDNFKAHDLAGPFEVDGRWFSISGDVQVDASGSDLISIGTASDKQVTIVRRGFRAGKYVLTYRFQWISGTRTGPLVRWVNPGDWIAVQLFHSDGKARLSKREADGNVTQLVTGTNTVSLTNNNWYTGKVVVGDDIGNAALQRLRFWVDTDDDGDFADETALLDTTTIDDVWSAGHVGLFRGSVSNAQDFDDFKAGIDANADLDIADAGDEVVVDDDFATNVISPAYDNNGNLTDDGVNKHVYDGWNRHVKSTWRIKSPPSAVVAYEHDGSYRRVSKVVTNSGVENIANDGGNSTQEYLFANGRLVEERNGSNQLTRAYMWHDGQLVWFEANGDPTIGNDSNPDLTATGEGSEAVADKRYFHHSDHRGRSSTLSRYEPGAGASNGQIAERRDSEPREEEILIEGAVATAEGARVLARSGVSFPPILVRTLPPGSQQEVPTTTGDSTGIRVIRVREETRPWAHGGTTCNPLRGPSSMQVSLPPAGTCQHICVAVHEGVHVDQLWECCRDTATHWAWVRGEANTVEERQAAMAEILRRWREWLDYNHDCFECFAYSAEFQCVESTLFDPTCSGWAAAELPIVMESKRRACLSCFLTRGMQVSQCPYFISP